MLIKLREEGEKEAAVFYRWASWCRDLKEGWIEGLAMQRMPRKGLRKH